MFPALRKEALISIRDIKKINDCLLRCLYMPLAKKIPPTDLKTTMSNFDEREERLMKLQGKGGGEKKQEVAVRTAAFITCRECS